MNHASSDTLSPPKIEDTPGDAGDFDTLSGDLEDTLADDLTLSGDLPATGHVDQPAQPRHIGPYRILRQLGRGGMGCVYLAQQQRPVERLVAIKLASPGFTGDGSRVLERFESERRTLSLLDHPNIARVLDAGTADDTLSSWPYFVMEYVEGDTVTDYCDTRRMDIAERVRLFIDVCRAVQHAHFKGVVHRDIKPSNLLVRDNDKPGDGKNRHEVKVIDFGIAALLEGDAGAPVATLTEAGSPIGTPHYASPEQLRLLDDNAVDLRSDVYGLGIVLYEILSGRLPWTPTDTAAGDGSWHAILQRINTGDAPSPSRRVLQLDEAEVTARGARSVQALAKELGGDLDWIIRRAIERMPQDRYASVGELADDLERYLSGEPVLAGPPSQVYRVRKFVARNRVGVAAAGLVAASLLAGLAGTSYYAVQSRQEARNARAAQQSALESEQIARQNALDARTSQILAIRSEAEAVAAKEEADLRAAEAAASAAYLLDVISLADPFETASIRTRDHLITQIINKLDEAAAPLTVNRPESLATMSLVPKITGLASVGVGTFDDFDTRSRLSPATEADLRDRLGHALLLHCRYIEGSVQLERAAVLLEQLAEVEADPQRQRELWRRSVLARRGAWECTLNMGPAYRESMADGVLTDAQRTAIAKLGTDDPVTIEIRADYAWHLVYKRRSTMGPRMSLATRIHDELAKHFGDETLPISTRIALHEMQAELAHARSDDETCESHMRRTVQLASAAHGESSYIAGRQNAYLAAQLLRMKRVGEAYQVAKLLHEDAVDRLGPANPASIRLELTLMQVEMGGVSDKSAFEQRLRDIIDVCRSEPVTLFDRALQATVLLTRLLENRQASDEAELAWGELINFDWPEDRLHRYRGEIYHNWSFFHADRYRTEQARTYMASAVEELTLALGEQHPRSIYAMAHYGLQLDRVNRPGQAEAIFQRARDAVGTIYPDGAPMDETRFNAAPTYLTAFEAGMLRRRLQSGDDFLKAGRLYEDFLFGVDRRLDLDDWAFRPTEGPAGAAAAAPRWVSGGYTRWLADHGQVDDAVRFRLSTFEQYLREYGPDHSVTLRALKDAHYAHIYANTGVELAEFLEPHLDRFDWPALVEFMMTRKNAVPSYDLKLAAEACEVMGDYPTAIRLWERSLQIAQRERSGDRIQAARDGLEKARSTLRVLSLDEHMRDHNGD